MILFRIGESAQPARPDELAAGPRARRHQQTLHGARDLFGARLVTRMNGGPSEGEERSVAPNATPKPIALRGENVSRETSHL